MAPSVSPTPFEVRDRIVRAAMELVGKKYKNLARGPEEYDCIGLILHAYKESGFVVPEIPAYSEHANGELVLRALKEVRNNGGKMIPINKARGGDLLILTCNADRYAGHCGVFHHDGDLIHATLWGRRVKKEPLRVVREKPVAAFSVVPE